MSTMTILEKLHKIEEKKCIYDIHYCRAGVGFLFYDPRRIKGVDETRAEKERHLYKPKNWREGLSVEKYYPTFEEAVESEFKRLKDHGKK